MNLLQQLRTRLQRRRKDPAGILDPFNSFRDRPGHHRDQYLTSEHFRDLSDENDDAAADDDEGYE